MKKIILYFLFFFILFFALPILFTNKFETKEVVSKDIIEENNITNTNNIVEKNNIDINETELLIANIIFFIV